MSSGDCSEEGEAQPTGFGVLGPLGDCMDLSHVEEASPRDQHMVNYGALSIKRAHSPPTLPIPSPHGVPPSLETLVPVVHASATSVIGKDVPLNLLWMG